MKPSLLILGLLIASPGWAAAPPSQTFKPASASDVQFEAIGRPSLLKIKGHGATVTGDLKIEQQTASGQFEIQLSELDTGIKLRNEHMKDNYLKVKEFPKAVLKLEPLKLPADWAPGKKLSTKFKGELTLKGKTKPVQGEFTIEGEKLSTEAKFTINLSDFEIGVPKYMGITVADTVTAQVKIPSFERK